MGLRARITGCAILIAAVLTPLSAQGPTADGVTIIEPAANSLVVGEVKVVAEVRTSRAAIVSVDVFVDGATKPSCRTTEPPFACSVSFGETIAAHTIRVIANLVDGRRLAATTLTARGVVESAEANAVIVPVIVHDYLGRFVKKLKRESFQVFEDNVPQELTFVDTENVPLDVVIAVDISGSMKASMAQLKTAVKRFLSTVDARARAPTRMTIVAFNDKTFVVSKPEAALAVRLGAVDTLQAFGGTALYDAILTSLGLFAKDISRKAVVIFTDGDDRSSLAPVEPVAKRIRESDATVYVITQGTEAEVGGVRRTVDQLAEISGGRSFSVDRIDKLAGALGFIVEDLSNQYLMGYTPSNTKRDGTFRRIRVTTTSNSDRIRAREGYRAPDP